MKPVRGPRRQPLRWLAACSVALLTPPAIAADKPPPPKTVPAAEDVNQDLLEFLGSADTQTDESSWFDFLRATDIGKLAKAKPKPAAPQEKK
jgi:hypothetical protein